MSRTMYARPRDLEQAVTLLGALDSGAMLIAGGQELMPYINYGQLEPAVLVDISGLKELTGIQRTDDGELQIAALSVHREIASSTDAQAVAPLLAHAASLIGGGRQVHNRGTIGGNIVSMNPLYDIIPPLLALGADVEVMSGDGTRRVGLDALMAETGHGLGASAILTNVFVPAQPAGTTWGYEKLKLTEGAYSSATAAAVVGLDADRHIEQLRLAIGAVGEQPQNMAATVAPLIGKPWSEPTAAHLGAAVSAAVRLPLSDQRGSAEYRRAMAGVIARRAVDSAISKIRN